MKRITKDYFDEVVKILSFVQEDKEGALEEAAQLLANHVQDDRLIHVMGTGGHSIMGAMELFYRAGNFANINPLFPAGLSLIDSHPNIERIEGYAPTVLKYYGVKEGDVLVLINVNGINAMTIDAALYARQIGAKIIAITSVNFSKAVPLGIAARHSSNQNLYELADIVIDINIPAGDALLQIEGLEQKIGAGSTYAVCFAGNLMCIRACEILVERGVTPPIWTSLNIKGGDEANREHMDKYLQKVHHLYPTF